MVDDMKKSGPIIVIEDDIEDQQLLDEIFKNLNFPNKIIFFSLKITCFCEGLFRHVVWFYRPTECDSSSGQRSRKGVDCF